MGKKILAALCLGLGMTGMLLGLGASLPEALKWSFGTIITIGIFAYGMLILMEAIGLQ